MFTLRLLLVLLKYINIDIFSYTTITSFYICCRSISLELFMVHRLGIKHEIQISIFVYSSETTNEMNKKSIKEKYLYCVVSGIKMLRKKI